MVEFLKNTQADAADDANLAGKQMPSLILASGSLQRVELLDQLGIYPKYIGSPYVDETPKFFEKPRALSLRLAKAKLQKAFASVQKLGDIGEFVILSADTVVSVGRRILPKATSVTEARSSLKLLSGRNHRVYTSVCVINREGYIFHRTVETRVKFMRLDNSMLDYYLDLDEWKDKAGAYAIQGYAGCFVIELIGSYSNVVGLPLYETGQLLRRVGYW